MKLSTTFSLYVITSIAKYRSIGRIGCRLKVGHHLRCNLDTL